MNNDDLTFGSLDLLQHGLQPFLELAAILRAGDHRTEIKRQKLLALQRLRHIAVDDTQCETLDDGCLADARFADQHRVVLGAAGQHLDGAANFLVTPDHRIELAAACQRGHVARVFLQRVEAGFGIRTVDLAALANVADRLLQRLRRGAGIAQSTSGRCVGGRDRRQQPVLRDVFVAGLGCGLLRGVKQTDQFRRDLRLAGTGALHLGQPGEFRFYRRQGGFGIAAGMADQARGSTFLIVQQCLQQMLGGDLLMEVADGNRLGGLQESPGPLGEFFNIHIGVPVRRRLASSPSLIRQRKRDPLAIHLGRGTVRHKGVSPCALNTCTATR